MKVTLVYPRVESFGSKTPPIGLAYLAAVIKKEGGEAEVFDMNVSDLGIKETAELIIKGNPQIVGISSTTPAITNALKIAQELKQKNPDLLIIMGGPHPTLMSDELLKNDYVDICVRGEGENPIKQIMKYVEKKLDLKEIKGITYKKGGKIIFNLESPLIDNLDDIPFPAWDLFDLEKYSNIVSGESLSLPVVTSRGCPFNCSFCFKGIFGPRWRFRSPENVVRELEYLVKNFKVEEFSVADDNFTLRPERAIRICKLINKRGLNLKWRCTNGIRADTASRELLSHMKKAGCYIIAFGVESGDQRIIKKINKAETMDDMRHAFENAKAGGIETIGFFMFGNLGENEETMQRTIDFAKELDPDYAQFSIAIPFPGSRMYQEVKKNGKILITRWESYAFYAGRPIFTCGEVTPELMSKMYKKAHRDFYLRPSYFLKVVRKVINSPAYIKHLFRGFKQYLNTQ